MATIFNSSMFKRKGAPVWIGGASLDKGVASLDRGRQVRFHSRVCAEIKKK